MRTELYDDTLTAAAKKRVRRAIRMYLYLMRPDNNDDDQTNTQDIENLVEQSMDAIDAVVHSYPPILSVSRLAPGA
jgi:hypothetical protein